MAGLLIVDDHPDSFEALKRALCRSGHEVESATNGREALDRLPVQNPDLVVLDLMMPSWTG